MNVFEEIFVPINILKKTIKKIREFGDVSTEGFALWVASQHLNKYQVIDVWIPIQENTFISYYIPETEVHRINVELNKKRIVPIAQLHSHPRSAYHSCIDDDFSILHLPYSYSIVIPNYGDIEMSNIFDEFVVYQLIDNIWKERSKEQVKKVFKLLK